MVIWSRKAGSSQFGHQGDSTCELRKSIHPDSLETAKFPQSVKLPVLPYLYTNCVSINYRIFIQNLFKGKILSVDEESFICMVLLSVLKWYNDVLFNSDKRPNAPS